MSGSDIQTIERKINSDLRKAQNNMFSGKNEEAWNMIEEIWTDIEQIRSIDSNYRNLKSLEQKYGKLRRDLEKKLGKGTTVIPKSTPGPAPSKKQVPSVQVKAPTVSKADDDSLPSGVLKRLGEIEKPLSQAEIFLSQAKNSLDIDKAERQIQLAERKYQEIERMYKENVNHPQVLEAREKISAIKKELEEASTKVLPAGVEKRLGDMDGPLSRADDYLNQAENSSDIDKARYQLQLSQGTYDEIERMYQDHLNHPEVVKTKEKLDEISTRLETVSNRIQSKEEQEEQAKSQMEERSKEWVQKIRPYLIGGGVSEKQLNLSRIRGKENLLHQKSLLMEAQKLYQEFEASDWSGGKTWDIEQAEKDLLRMITDGQEAYDQSIKSVIDEASSLIEEKLNWFKNDNAWRTDSSIRPSWLYTRDRESIEENMSLVYELVPEIIPRSYPELGELENKLNELMKENQERLIVIPQRTFMVPSKYLGDDSAELESKAGELVKEKVPDATILRVHLIREDWRVEDVIEHTDTSRTAIRHRITYNLPAQVAAKVGDKVLLYNAHIAKNQRPDGSFDSLTGNLEDYPQTINTENLPK